MDEGNVTDEAIRVPKVFYSLALTYSFCHLQYEASTADLNLLDYYDLGRHRKGDQPEGRHGRDDQHVCIRQ